jgi:hypothetical protein
MQSLTTLPDGLTHHVVQVRPRNGDQGEKLVVIREDPSHIVAATTALTRLQFSKTISDYTQCSSKAHLASPLSPL